PAQMGLLVAVQNLPFLLVGLMAGVWVDRFRRRPILVTSDLANALALATIPLAVVLGVLRFEQLLIVGFVTGTALVISSVAYQSLIPSLVPRSELVDANAALEVSSSTATILGPSVGGVLVQLLTAPVAIVADVVSYLFSAITLAAIRKPEPPPIAVEHRASATHQIVEGLRLVAGHPLLRSIMACGTIHNFFSRMIDALFILFAVTIVGLDPITLGLVLAAAGPGSLLGALLSSRVPERLGLGRTLIAGQLITGVSRLLIPLAVGPLAPAAVLAASMFLLGFARPIFNVNQLSLRQAITPDRLQGRVNATMRFVMWGVTPVGAVLGGIAASAFGMGTVLLVAGLGVLAATLPLVLSPVAALKHQPDPSPPEGGR
nr:MFS transporter [Chloroflexota bacterium]